MLKLLILSFSLTLFLGCSDNSITKIHTLNIATKNIDCLKLVVFPPDKVIEDSMNSLYNFKDSCKYRVEVSKKGGIHCNSSHSFSAYLKLDIYMDKTPLYNYYIDLKGEPKESDIKSAFKRLKKDLVEYIPKT